MEPGYDLIRLIENPDRRAQAIRVFLTFPGFPAAQPHRWSARFHKWTCGGREALKRWTQSFSFKPQPCLEGNLSHFPPASCPNSFLFLVFTDLSFKGHLRWGGDSNWLHWLNEEHYSSPLFGRCRHAHVVCGAWQPWCYFYPGWQMAKVGAPFCHLACWKWHREPLLAVSPKAHWTSEASVFSILWVC